MNKSSKVLVIGSNADMRLLLTSLVYTAGIQMGNMMPDVRAYEDIQGLQAFLEKDGRPDLVIVDLPNVESSAYDILAAVRVNGCDAISVIFIAGKEMIRQAMGTTFSKVDFVQRPFDNGTVTERIQRWLACASTTGLA